MPKNNLSRALYPRTCQWSRGTHTRARGMSSSRLHAVPRPVAPRSLRVRTYRLQHRGDVIARILLSRSALGPTPPRSFFDPTSTRRGHARALSLSLVGRDDLHVRRAPPPRAPLHRPLPPKESFGCAPAHLARSLYLPKTRPARPKSNIKSAAAAPAPARRARVVSCH